MSNIIGATLFMGLSIASLITGKSDAMVYGNLIISQIYTAYVVNNNE